MAMQRTVEPELMNEQNQVEAYALADFENAHQAIVDSYDQFFPNQTLNGNIIDLGCGSGDISFRYAKRFINCQVIGIDGANKMIDFAEQRKQREQSLSDRLEFITCLLPDISSIPKLPYSAIISNSLLHHLHDPQTLWSSIKQIATPGTKVLISDLYRPHSQQAAKQLVKQYAENEPDILQTDFYHSLLAAFTPEEIHQQLSEAQLNHFQVSVINDRHVIMTGIMR